MRRQDDKERGVGILMKGGTIIMPSKRETEEERDTNVKFSFCSGESTPVSENNDPKVGYLTRKTMEHKLEDRSGSRCSEAEGSIETRDDAGKYEPD